MFGKNKDNQPKVKELSPREILKAKITAEIESLTPGQKLYYQLPEFYTFARFFMVALNPMFPKNGKKYLMCQDSIADGKPAGKIAVVNDTNKASQAAEWISERDSDEHGHIKRFL